MGPSKRIGTANELFARLYGRPERPKTITRTEEAEAIRAARDEAFTTYCRLSHAYNATIRNLRQ